MFREKLVLFLKLIKNKQKKQLKVKTTLIFFILNLSISLSQEIGLQLWSLRNQFEIDVEKSLSIINSWGIKYVEGGSTMVCQKIISLNY